MTRKIRSLKLDRLDVRILAVLQAAGRITNLELANKVGLSATPCMQRVKRMESAGYITGYSAQIEMDLLAPNVVVFTEITLRNHRREDFIHFEREIAAVPQVLSCFLVTGGYDYLAQFIAKDILDYQITMEKLLERDLGIDKYFSYVTIKKIKGHKQYPLAQLIPDDLM
jgi:DNA-binding Lrp family transcriptional regulator